MRAPLAAHPRSMGTQGIAIVRQLLASGVDIVDQLGKSPLDLALARLGGRIAEGSDTVAQILRGAAN